MIEQWCKKLATLSKAHPKLHWLLAALWDGVRALSRRIAAYWQKTGGNITGGSRKIFRLCRDKFWPLAMARGRKVFHTLRPQNTVYIPAANAAPRRATALALILCLVLSQLPVSALGTDTDTYNHTHNKACGYVEAVEGSPCNHTNHDENCGYVEAVPETPCDKSCTDTDGDGVIDHAPDCAYTPAVEGHPCKHEQGIHDQSCGYIEAVEGSPCTHEHDADCGGLPAQEPDTPVLTAITALTGAPEAVLTAMEGQLPGLPAVLTGVYEDGTVEIPITWDGLPIPGVKGEYILTAVLTLPGGYALGDNVTAPRVGLTLTADPAVEPVRALLADLPDPAAVAALLVKEEATQDDIAFIEQWSEQTQAAMDAYDALTEGQQALLPEAQAAFEALMAAFRGEANTLATAAGTEENPILLDDYVFTIESGKFYEVNDLASLNRLATLVNQDDEERQSCKGATILVTADIGSPEEGLTTSIGIYEPDVIHEKDFQGTFRSSVPGTKRTIWLNQIDSGQGLFGLTTGATIQDITAAGVVSSDPQASTQPGGIVCLAQSGTVIKDCTNYADVKGDGAGGIVGNAYTVTREKTNIITGCINRGTITCGVGNNTIFPTGGIAGTSVFSRFENCWNDGEIVNDSFYSSGMSFGGIVADAAGSVISGCLNTGKVSVAGSSADYVGGIVGTALAEKMLASEPATATTVKDCANTGQVWGCLNVGGIAGILVGEMERCYNTGEIRISTNHLSGPGGTTDADCAVGGIVGRFQTSYKQVGSVTITYDNAKLANCVSLGRQLVFNLVENQADLNVFHFDRIAAVSDGPLSNNYARADMEAAVDNADWDSWADFTVAMPASTDPSSTSGKGLDPGCSQDWNTWFGNVDTNVWNLPGGKLDSKAALPTLKNIQDAPVPTYSSGTHEDHDGVTFQAWSDPNALPSTTGNYYLLCDVTLSNGWSAPGGIKLCLNGHTVNTGANSLSPGTGTLSIYNCKPTGQIIGSGDVIKASAANSNLYVHGGTITSTGKAAIASNGSVYINGGTVSGKTCGVCGTKSGEDPAVHITGGTVRSTEGPAVNIGTKGGLYLSGNPTITGASGMGDIQINRISDYSGGLHAMDNRGTNSYTGVKLSILCGEALKDNDTVVANVNEGNKDKFTLVNDKKSLIYDNTYKSLRLSENASAVTLADTKGEAENGTYSVSFTSTTSAGYPYWDDKVTINYAAKEGYLLDSVKVTETGNESNIVDVDNVGGFSFIMPHFPVTVKVTFKMIPPPEPQLSGNDVTVDYGKSALLTVTIGGVIGFQPVVAWYEGETAGGTSIPGATGMTYTTPDSLSAGPHKYTVRVTITRQSDGATSYADHTFTVTVNAMNSTITAWPTIQGIYVGDTLTDDMLVGTENTGGTPGVFSITGAKTWDRACKGLTTVTFTPTDSNYQTAVKEGVTVTVSQRSISAVASLADIADKAFGTAFEDLGLPATVEVTASGNVTRTLTVTWNQKDYTPNKLGQQTITGTLTGTDEVAVGKHNASILVTLQAKTVTAPDFPDKTGAVYSGSPIPHTIASLPTGIASAAYTYEGKDGTDYAKSEQAPTNVGSYTVTATFTMEDGYTQLAPVSASLTIQPKALAPSMLVVTGSYTYDGTEQAIQYAVTDGSAALKAEDYTAVVSGTKNAGKGTVTVTGKGNYTGEISKEFSIAPRPAALTWNVPDTPPVYDGTEKSVAATVSNAIEGDIFTLTYTGNAQTAAGDYTAQVTALGNSNYTLEVATGVTQAWRIEPKTDALVTITPETADLTYTGSQQIRGIAAVSVDGKETTDYTVTGNTATNAGAHTLTVEITDGNYKGSTGTALWSIGKATPTAGDFTFAQPVDLVYSGETMSAAVTAKDGVSGMGAVTVNYGKTPVTDAGTYTVAIDVAEGDNYTAATGLTDNAWTFTITPKPYNNTDFTIAQVPNQPYTGLAITPKPEVKFGTITLVEGTDFEYEYQNNVNVGNGTVAVNFIGNFSGTDSRTFTIVNAPLPAGTENNDVFEISGADLLKWHKEDITLAAKDGWTVGRKANTLGASVTLDTESVKNGETVTPSSDVLYVGKDGQVYQTAVTYLLDKTPPTITDINGNPTYYWTNQDVKITFKATDDISGVEEVTVQRDGVNYPVTATDNYSFTADQNGSYFITVTDHAGKTAKEIVAVEKIDKAIPKKPIVTGYTSDNWAKEAFVLHFSTTDTKEDVPSGIEYQIYLPGEGWGGFAADVKIDKMQINAEQWRFRAVSGAGTYSEEVAFIVKQDQVKPDASLKMTAGGVAYDGSEFTAHDVVITPGNTTDNISGVTYYYQKSGDTTWTELTTPDLTVNENCDTTFTFKAVSGAGLESDTQSVNVKRSAMSDSELEKTQYGPDDFKNPSTPNEDGWYGKTPTVTVTPKDTVGEGGLKATTYYELYKYPATSGEKTKLTEPWQIKPESDGRWTLNIWTEDVAGNHTNPYTVKLLVDTKAPDITGVTGNPTAWVKEEAKITFNVTDDTSGVEGVTVQRDGVNYPVTGMGDYSFTADQNGTYFITVIDHAGKTAKETVAVEKIDKADPVVKWDSATSKLSPDKWYGKTALTATATDDSGEPPAVTLTTSGETYANGATIEKTGSYTFYAIATDGVGRVSRSAPLTVRIETAIDGFADRVAGLSQGSGYQDILDVMNWYNSQSATVKDRLSKNDDAQAAYERLLGLLQDKSQEAANGVTDKIMDADTIDKIQQAVKDYDALPNEAKNQVPGDVKEKLEQKKKDADTAQKVIDQLANADREKKDKDPGAFYEEKQAAQESYNKLTPEQKALVDWVAAAVEDKEHIDGDLAAIDSVLNLLKDIKKPYSRITKEQIKAAGDAYNALNQKQKDAFPKAEKQRLDELESMRQNALAVEDQIKALGDTPNQDALNSAKGAYDSLTADEKAMVDGELKSQLNQKYQDMLDKMNADEKAAAEFSIKVEETQNAPTVDKITQLVKDYGALSEAAKEKLTDKTKKEYEKLTDDLNQAKPVIDKLNGIDTGNLKPENMEQVKEALAAYDKLTDGQKKLADEATGGKAGILKDAVDSAKEVTDKIEAIPQHGPDSTVTTPDGEIIPNLDDCGDAGNESPGGGLNGHTFEEHKSAIEEAKIAYEKLTDAGRKLVSEAAKEQLNNEYNALMRYLEYHNTAMTATTKVEVAGLAENVALPAESASAPKTVISVVMADSKPETMPPIPTGKSEALSVDIKLVAKIYDVPNATATDTPTAQELVQPKDGEKVLVKLKVPSGYQNDTLELWHVKDNGGRSRIQDFWLATEADGIYAVFEVDSFSHFVFFAEKTSTGGGGSVAPSAPRPEIASSSNGSVSIEPKQPKPGDTVIIKPQPDKGYVVDQVTVIDQNSKVLPVKDNGNGTWSYTQPNGKVTVTVTFKPGVETVGLPFTDVKDSDWFYDSVKYVYEKGLMNGTAGDKFSPYLNNSRGMIVTILWRLEGGPKEAVAAPFSDLAADAYYGQAVAWGAEHSIVNGYGNGKFGPNDPITRQQLAAILYRYAQYKGLDTTAKGDLAVFNDQPDSWAQETVRWAIGTGIIAGKGSGVLDPNGHATRAETAAMLTRYLQDK